MTHLYCGFCGGQMHLIQGLYSVYYRCEKCTNRLSVQDLCELEELSEGQFDTECALGSVKRTESGETIIIARRKKRCR